MPHITPYSPGRRWYCDRTTNAHPGLHRPPFTFVVVGPGPTPDQKICRIEHDRAWFEAQGYNGENLDRMLERMGEGSSQPYSHKHLKRYAELQPLTPA